MREVGRAHVHRADDPLVADVEDVDASRRLLEVTEEHPLPGEAIRNDLSTQTSSASGGPATPTYEIAPSLKAGTSAADAATPGPTTGRAQRYSAQLTLSVKDVDALSDAPSRRSGSRAIWAATS